MANSYFKIQNGLEVGPLTINAVNGDISTSGNVSISGSVGVSQITKNDSSISINDVGASSTIVFALDGATEGTFSASGLTVNGGFVNAVGNLMAQAGTFNAMQVNGNHTVTGFVNVTGNVLAAAGRFNEIDLNGFLNSSGNILATGGVLNSLTVNGSTNTQDVVPLASNTYSIGSSTLWYSSLWGLAVNAQYADLAEKYSADAVYEPGTVLEFGGVHEVTVCNTVMSTRVAGVVSTDPAYLMNHQIAGDTVVDLALTGRVPTRVVGPVKKGDLMVSAGNGRAQAEADPRVGTVIGKALEDFGAGEGIIEVVVGVR